MYKQIFNVVRLVAVLALLLVFTGQFAKSSNTGAEATTPLSWKPIALKNGWAAYEDGTRAPAYAINPSNNMIHLRGAIHAADGGFESLPFRLPASHRPAGIVYHPIDSCDATYARIVITTDGWVQINGNEGALECFVSLEGVTFSRDGAGVINTLDSSKRQKKRS